MSMQDIKYYDSSDFPAYLPKLNALYDDLFSHGKGFRSKLIKKISKHLELPDKNILLLAQTIEFVHNASLLHDDLIDRSELRRNKPAAWHKYTPEYAVLAGDYLLARVMVNLSKHGNLKLIQYTAEMISDLLEGEWIQDSLVSDWNVPLDQLDKVHNLKTASLFKWCLRAPFIIKEDYRPELHDLLAKMGSILGVLFQRSDDLLDFNVRNYEKKAVMGDLKSGYLNSFGAYINQNLTNNEKDPFRKSESLEQVYAAITQDKFDKYVASFDQMNIELIELYSHYIKQLGELLDDKEAGIPKDLEKLPKLLYWRET